MSDDLSEFLLARIAEDEANARDAENYFPDDGPFLRWDSDRVLAECDAKRRIVEDFEILHRDYRETHSRTTEARRFQARVAMARLALPYADHPDYDEAWRP